jgi:hypothetical protein
MSTAIWMKRIREVSPRLKARIASVLFLLLLLTAAFTEFFVRGKLSFAADLAVGIIEVSCMIAVTLLLYDIFKSVNRSLSLLAASFNFVGDRGSVLADLSVTAARKLSVPLQSGLRPPRGRIRVPVAPRDGPERSTMEGAGQRSRGKRMKAAFTRYGPPDVIEVKGYPGVEKAIACGRARCAHNSTFNSETAWRS